MTPSEFAAVIRAGAWWHRVTGASWRRQAWQEEKRRNREVQRRERRERAWQMAARAATVPQMKRVFKSRVGTDLETLPGLQPMPWRTRGSPR